ncbi:hypothetical protein TD95_001055 [Thielaviopsis punctulata]|uniref:RRM domain-containing protein n=1 Tax=Thielaviopsis punctulata TaxID=72032 RepID=A0A0F4Z9X6_9PEZI|nr:hypothetical protein TD95_001065 [Thielaviopsis punctulata]KKA26961.1 hypothetical protein TD95_001055 [Thielaviopsis punctulata]
MAPATRTRSVASTPASASKTKRKADEDASPAVNKKAKSTPKAAKASAEKETRKPSAKAASKTSEKKSAPKSASKSKKTKADEPEEEAMDIEKDESTEVAIQDEDVEEEVDAELQALAAGLDSDNEAPSKNNSTFKPGQDVGKIPALKGQKKGGKPGEKEKPGVVYIGRIPHGFYENEMKQYFSQFGPILRLRMSRNKRTGASKHFAFIEFSEESTAEIVSKTMDNYLLFGHILKCKVVSPDRLHADVWKGANKRYKKIPFNKMEGLSLQKPKTQSAWEKKIEKENQKRLDQAKKLKALGYHFKPTVVKSAPEPVAAIEAVEEPKTVEAAEKPKAIEEKKETKEKKEKKETKEKKEKKEKVEEKEEKTKKAEEEKPAEPKPTPKKRGAAKVKAPQQPTRMSTRNKKPAQV